MTFVSSTDYIRCGVFFELWWKMIRGRCKGKLARNISVTIGDILISESGTVRVGKVSVLLDLTASAMIFLFSSKFLDI